MLKIIQFQYVEGTSITVHLDEFNTLMMDLKNASEITQDQDSMRGLTIA